MEYMGPIYKHYDLSDQCDGTAREFTFDESPGYEIEMVVYMGLALKRMDSVQDVNLKGYFLDSTGDVPKILLGSNVPTPQAGEELFIKYAR